MISHHGPLHTQVVARADGGRVQDQVGAVLVELAIVAMFLVTITAGAYDYGMAWRVGLVTNEASRTAARTGSAMGANPLADWYALSGAKAALKNSGRLQDVQQVIVYRSSTTNGAVPTDCLNSVSGTTQKCVVLTGSAFRNMNQANFNSTTGCFQTAVVQTWCPSSRNNVQLTSEYYGIYIKTRYNHLFRTLNKQTDLERTAVMRLEPTVS